MSRWGRWRSGKIRPFGYRWIGFMHADRDGSPVLTERSSWRTINGVYLTTPWGYGYLLFRRLY